MIDQVKRDSLYDEEPDELESPFDFPTIDPDEYDPDEDEPDEGEPCIYGDLKKWIVTPEQVARIRSGDWEACRVFMRDNAYKLFKMACSYARKKNAILESHVSPRLYFPDEMITQLTLDLPLLHWRDDYTLCLSIKYLSFAWCPFGGYSQRREQGLTVHGMPWAHGLFDPDISLDTPIAGTDDPDMTLAGTLKAVDTDRPDLVTAFPGLTPESICEMLSDILQPRESQFLRLYLSGTPYADICRAMRTKDALHWKNRVHNALVFHYREILARLETAGATVPAEYQNAVPGDYDEIVATYQRKPERDPRRLTPEERTKRARARQKAWREAHPERKKQAQKAYREAHREEIRVYNQAHREAINEQRRNRRKAERVAQGMA